MNKKMEKVAKVWLNEEKGVLTCRTPFSTEFLTHIKSQIPKESRRWVAESKVWEFEVEYVDRVLSILRTCFDKVMELSTGSDQPKEDLFSILKEDDIKAIYRLLAKRYHPDTGRDDGTMMKKINEFFREIKGHGSV